MTEFTYSYVCYYCEVKAFISYLSFKSILIQIMRKVIDVLADPDCEVICPMCVDYNLIR